MIFISHSSKDKAAALDLQQRLLGYGYDISQLFLDSDAETGIPAGSKWEQVLYGRLKDCRALIVLCSANWQGSRWCFAELVFAKAMGKEIFPVLLQECAIDQVAAEHQAVFVYKEGEAAYARLWGALDARHLGPRDDFGWPPKDGDHCPFPGLPSFDERLAGVYFGREAETQALLEDLRKMRANGEPRLLMIVGGSGSGKSSLLKAGVLPRLKHKTFDTEWFVLPTLRYGEQANQQRTIFDQLVVNLVELFPKDAKSIPDWKCLATELSSENVKRAVKVFLENSQDLTLARNCSHATVLIAIDQFEELLAPSAGQIAARFLVFLKELLNCSNGQLLVIATMRSDHLDLYEKSYAALPAPFFQSWRLGPFPRERIEEVIRKPASRAQVEITTELVDRLKRDTPTVEALPLLAFTLEKLYRGYASDGRLELQEYESLGGMEGCIQKCIERIVPRNSLSETEAASLRLSFVKHLAQVEDKGEVVRLRARWDDLPSAAKPILEKFVNERLLVRPESEDQDKSERQSASIEVAHEAMFRCWDDLKEWLRASADILRWRRDVRRDQANDPKWTGLRPAQLVVARDWPRKRRDELTAEEVKWIKKGILWERIRRGAAIAVALFLTLLAGLAWWQMGEASKNAEEAKLAQDAAETQATIAATQRDNAVQAKREALRELGNVDWLLGARARENEAAIFRSGHLFLRSAKEFQLVGENALAKSATLAMEQGTRRLLFSLPNGGELLGAAPIRDENYILTWSEEGTMRLWALDRNKPIQTFKHEGELRGAILNQNNSRILTWGYDGTVLLWAVGQNEPLQRFKHGDDAVNGAVFNRDETRVLSFSADGTACLWALGQNEPVQTFEHMESVKGASFNDDETQILTWGDNGVSLWRMGQDEPVQSFKYRIRGATFNRDGSGILTWGNSGAQLWKLGQDEPAQIFKHSNGWGASFNHDKSRILTFGFDGTVRLWVVGQNEPVQTFEHMESIKGASFNDDEKRILTWSSDGTVGLWAIGQNEPIQTFKHGGKVSGAVFNRDESRILSWSDDGTVRVWTMAQSNPVQTFKDENGVYGAMFEHNESRILTWTGDGAVRFWAVAPAESMQSFKHKELIGASFGPDKMHVLTWGRDGTIRFWAVGQNEPVQTFEDDSAIISAVFNRDEGRILTWDGVGNARQWAVGQKDPIRTFKHDAWAKPKFVNNFVVFGHDQSRVLTWSDDGTVHLWAIGQNEPVQTFKDDGILISVVFNHDGSRILTSGFHGARLWAVGQSEAIEKFTDERGANGAKFNRDESRILTWSAHGPVLLWAMGQNKPIQAWQHRSLVHGALFNRDESCILTWSDDGTARLWKVGQDKPIQVFEHGEAVKGAIFNGDESRVLTWGGNRVNLWAVGQNEPIRTFTHKVSVKGAVFNRDESCLLTWGDISPGSTVTLWAVGQNEPVQTFRDESGVYDAMFDDDETRILTWGYNGTARLWDVSFDEDTAPDERILEFQVRTATRLYGSNELRPLSLEEWMTAGQRLNEMRAKH